MPKPSGKRVAVVALSTLLVVAILNFATGVYLQGNTPNEGYRRIQRKWEMLVTMKEPVDTLIIGDSSGAQGVDPELVERAFGGEAVNLCTIADMTVVNSATMLDEYVRKFGAPKRVILVHVYDIWEREMTGYALARTPYSPFENPEALNWFPVDGGKKKEWIAGAYMPLFAENKSLMQAGKAFLKGGTPRGKGPREDGFSVAEKPNPKQLESDLKLHTQNTAEPKGISDDNLLALQHMAKLAKEHGFPIYLVNSPLYEKVWQDEPFQARYYKTIDGVEKAIDKDRITYLFRTPQTFPATHMTNADHLTYEGAREFTAKLIGAMEAVQE